MTSAPPDGGVAGRPSGQHDAEVDPSAAPLTRRERRARERAADEAVARLGSATPPPPLIAAVEDPRSVTDRPGAASRAPLPPGAAPFVVGGPPVALAPPEGTAPTDAAVKAPRPLRPTTPGDPRAGAVVPTTVPADVHSGGGPSPFPSTLLATASVVWLVVGAMLVSAGGSLRQSLLAAVLGSGVTVVLVAVMIVVRASRQGRTVAARPARLSRAEGTFVAAIEASTAVVAAGVSLWLLAEAAASALGGADILPLQIGVAAGGLAVATVIVFGNERSSAKGHRIYAAVGRGAAGLVSVAGAIVVAGAVSRVDLGVALSLPDGPWTSVSTGVILVASLMTAILMSSTYSGAGRRGATSRGDDGAAGPPDRRPPHRPGPAVVVGVSAGFVMTVAGILVAASDPEAAGGLLTRPVQAISDLVPVWMLAPLAVSVAVTVLGVVGTTVARGLAFGRPRPGLPTMLGSAAAIGGVCAPLIVAQGDPITIIRDLVPTMAVPAAGCLAMMGALVFARRIVGGTEVVGTAEDGTAEGSTVDHGGALPQLLGLVVIVVVGWGLISSRAPWLAWQGFLFPLLDIPTEGAVATSDPGVLAAVLLGVMAGIVIAVIRPSRPRSLPPTTPR
jgi:hypothetical protein